MLQINETPLSMPLHGNFTHFYDICRAYDSITWPSIKLCMERLHLPSSFISLVIKSLKGSTACERTAFGLSDTSSVTKSIKQGCLFAVLLFIMVMNPPQGGRDPYVSDTYARRSARVSGVMQGCPVRVLERHIQNSLDFHTCRCLQGVRGSYKGFICQRGVRT